MTFNLFAFALATVLTAAPSALPAPPATASPERSVEVEIESAARAFRTQGAELPVIRRPAGVVFPFGHGSAPVLRCAPLRVCVVELEAGEIVLNTVLGDSDRWLVDSAATGPAGGTPLVVVKPTGCDLTTNLIVSTDRRVYELLLSSPACREDQLASLNPELPYTSLVRFYYPDDLVRSWAAGDRLAAQKRHADEANLTPLATDPTALNFRYELSGRRFPWRPEQVFDDGRHTYIKLPKSAGRFPAPLLFVLGEDDSTSLLNYTERGGFLIADRVLERALLVLGDGAKGRSNRRELRLTNLALRGARQ